MKLRHRFRPSLEILEDRQCPSLTLQGDTLLIQGAQGTSAAEVNLSIVRNTGNNYTVTYGTDSGTFNVDNIKVDLGGGTLFGKVLVDLGASVPAALPQSITVDHGTVYDNVQLTNLDAGTAITLGGAGLTMESDLDATGRTDLAVTGDSVHVAGPSTVNGNVNLTGLASFSTDAATVINGWVKDYATGVPAGPAYQEAGGFNFQSLGEVDSFVTVQGGATTGHGVSTVHLGGTIFDTVTINVTGGNASVDTNAHVVGAGFNFTAAASVSDTVIVGGQIDGNADINLGGSASTVSALALVGTVGGSYGVSANFGNVNVTGQSGAVLIVTALPTGPGTWEAATIDGSLTVDLSGNGTDVLVLNKGQGAVFNGGVSFTGGTGFDREIVTH